MVAVPARKPRDVNRFTEMRIQRGWRRNRTHSLSSIRWSRGRGRGGAPLLGPLPTPPAWGEEEENTPANLSSLRRFGQLLIDNRPPAPRAGCELFYRFLFPMLGQNGL